MKQIIFLLFFAVIATLQSQTISTIASIPKPLLDNANSVVMAESIEIDVSKPGKLVRKTESTVAILNKLGNKYIENVIYFDPNTRVKNVEVYVLDAFGKEINHFKKRDFKDVSAADGISIYNDDRMLYLEYTPTTYPYIFVFRSEVESDNTAFINPWYPVGGYTQSAQKSEFTLLFDPANKPRVKLSNVDGTSIKITETANSFVGIAENIAVLQYEELGPSFTNVAPKVSFALDSFTLKGTPGNGKDWKEFGNWMDSNLLKDTQQLPEGTISKMKDLVANETTNEGKARKIYQYLQDKVRYISVQIGIGGWKPSNATDVDKLSYGDCKALSNYTQSLLAAVGVPSYYTVLFAGDNEQDIQADFTAIQGNHAMLAIPNDYDYMWLECTSQNTPFGFLGNFSDDRDVLLITPEGGKIAHTKKYTASENLQHTNANVFLDADGGVMAATTIKSYGQQYDDYYMITKETKNEIDNILKKRWSYLNGMAVHKADFVNNRDSIVFTENLNLKIPYFATSVGNDFLFCPNIFNQSSDIPTRYTSRKHKLYITKGTSDISSIHVEIPQNYSLEALPQKTEVINKFGSYEISFNQKTPQKLEYVRKLTINKGTYAPEDYEAYRDFRKQIAKLDKTKILLKQK